MRPRRKLVQKIAQRDNIREQVARVFELVLFAGTRRNRALTVNNG